MRRCGKKESDQQKHLYICDKHEVEEVTIKNHTFIHGDNDIKVWKHAFKLNLPVGNGRERSETIYSDGLGGDR